MDEVCCTTHEKDQELTKLVGRPKWKMLLGRPWRRWKHNIKMDLNETVWDVWTEFKWLEIGYGGALL
jgi:hypothetical protein